MSIKVNIAANYLGQGWTALMQLAFIPIYINYLGMEAYGLIGFFAMLQAGLALLDMGMTPTLNREMARYQAGTHTTHSIRVLLRSIEVLSAGFALLIVLMVWLVSDWLARHWLRAEQLSFNTVSHAITIMGLFAALRFVEGVYRGAILGLQTHAWLNGASSLLATVRALGAVAVLAWVSSSIEAFFVWQAFVSMITVTVFAIRVHSQLPTANGSVYFSLLPLSKVWKFAQGMVLTAFLSLLLTHGDKVLLSRILSLEAFGTYMLAALVSNSLYVLIGPLAQSYSPRFAELVARRDEAALIKAYHRGSQLMAVTVVPAALLLIFESQTLLNLWTNDAVLARNSAPYVALLTLGTAFLGLMNIPYMLQLAYGWSTFAAKVNGVIVLVQIPALIWITTRYGAMGAAWVWVAVTASYIFVVIGIMHKYLLPTEKWAWYWRDNFLPIAAAAATGGLLSIVSPATSNPWLTVVWLIFFGVAMFIAAVWGAPDLRLIAIQRIRYWMSKP